DDSKSLDVVRELGHLPLAIDIAGALMVEERMTPSQYLESFKEDTRFHLGLDDTLDPKSATNRKAVGTVWNISFERIKTKNSLAADLLRSIALFYPDNIPSLLFHRHLQTVLSLDNHQSVMSVKSTLKCLRDFSLIHRTVLTDARDDDPANDTFAIHR